MIIVALDLGDKWVGTAISDAVGITARPYQTVQANQLHTFLTTLIPAQQVNTIVVGNPKTMRGTESEQTKKIHATFEHLKNNFPTITWVLWDERMSSKQASKIHKTKTKEDKQHSHSVAAAIILSSYLDYRHFQSTLNNP
jgi:putative Holliday junction resolvase